MRFPFRRHAIDWIRPRADSLVYASQAYIDLKSSLNEASSDLVDFAKEPRAADDLALLEVLQSILPREWPEERLIRIGGNSDGGYVMDCDLDVQGALSIGVGEDISWDSCLAERGIPVIAFDHTVSKLPAPIAGITFHKLGLGVRSTGHLRHLSDLMEMSGLSVKQRNILKIDIEGNEWAVLSKLDPSVLSSFSQVVIEFHGLDKVTNPEAVVTMLPALRALTSNHVPIHMHANNYGRLFRTTSYWFVDTVEVLLVSRQSSATPPFATRIASELDAPCDPRVSDINLENALSAIAWFPCNE